MAMIRLIDGRQLPEKDLDTIRDIYTGAFPPEERRDWQQVQGLLAGEAPFWLKAAYADEGLVGFITGWDFPDFIYMEHFATAPSARNKGYGAVIFREILSSCERPHVIEVGQGLSPAPICGRRQSGTDVHHDRQRLRKTLGGGNPQESLFCHVTGENALNGNNYFYY